MTRLQTHAIQRDANSLFAGRSTPVAHAVWSVNFDYDNLETEALRVAEHTAQVAGNVIPGAQIHPVHILDPTGLSWQGETAQDRSDRLGPIAEFAVEEMALHASRFLKVNEMRKPFITTCDASPIQSSTRCSARKIASWAKKFNADLVIVNHRTLTGLSKVLHPSFAEQLIAETDLPLLVLTDNREVKASPITEIVFPTDFSDDCCKSFEIALSWAKYLNVPIILFHKPGPPPAPAISSGALLFGGWSEIVPENIAPNGFQKESANWCAFAEAQGIHAEFIRAQTSRSTADAIHALCTSLGNPLLVMSACLGPLESGLWGSITRDVMSQSRAPVLILRG